MWIRGKTRLIKYLLPLLFTLLLNISVVPHSVAESTGDLMVAVAHPYYLHGETAVIHVQSTPFTEYHLQIINPEATVVYDEVRVTSAVGDDTVKLPIVASAVSGSYVIQASLLDCQYRCKVTVLNTADYTATVFPYVYKHRGVNYTFNAKGFQAVGASGNINIVYPSLPVSFSVTAYYNNMSFVERIRNVALGITIDLAYMFIHNGMKFRVNGTLPQASTFTFHMDSLEPLKKLVQCVRDGNLVFDWSDLKKAGSAFTYNQDTQQLTVNIPASFLLDPYVFSDGFESGDFSAWTTETVSGTGSTSVISIPVHHGSYSGNFSLPASGDIAYYDKTLSDSTLHGFARAYVRFSDVWTEADTEASFAFTLGPKLRKTTVDAGCIIRYNGTQYFWGTRVENASGSVNTYSATGFTLSASNWYCLEIEEFIDNEVGYVSLKVDDVLVTNTTGLDNNNWGNITTIQIGAKVFLAVGGIDLYYDCVVADISAIGLEASNTAPVIGEFEAPSTVYANQGFHLNASVNDADGITDIVNCTISIDTDIVLKWDNATATFSEVTDTYNYVTLTTGSCVESEKNATAFDLSWYITINNWGAGSKSVLAADTEVWDATESANGSHANLFTFSYITWTLQARDNTGVNLPRAIAFSGTLGNSTTYTSTSSTAGLSSITTCYGTHTVTASWQGHTVYDSASVAVTADKTSNLDTRIARLSSGSNYVLVSVDSTSLNTPLLMPNKGWMIQSIQGSSNREVKVDHANWLLSGEPRFFKVRGSLYERGCNDWSWTSSIFTWSNLDFTLLEYADIEMVWILADAPVDDSGTTTVTSAEPVDSDEGLVVTPGYIPVSPPPVALYWILMLGGGAFIIVFIMSVKPDTRWPKSTVGKTQFPQGKGKKLDRKRWKKK